MFQKKLTSVPLLLIKISNKFNNSSINLGSRLFSIKISINSFIKEIFKSDFESFKVDFSIIIIAFE